MKTQLSLMISSLIFSGCIYTMKKPPEEVTVMAPASVANTVDPNDSNYLRITLQKINYKIALMSDSLVTNDTIIIDKFILERKNFIDTNKILLSSEQDANKENYIPISRILKKYGYFRFRIKTDD